MGRILNSLPEGVLVALFAWVTLRLLPRQNSGTRFAVWFVALLAVAGLPLIGSILGPQFLQAASGGHPLITLPGPWGALLLLAWVLAVSAGMLRLAVGLWRVRRLRRNCITIDSAQLEPAVQKTLADFSSSRSVALATSEDLSVPSALGFFRPMIVIPTWALRELPAEELNIILLHEFAHVRRWDDWTNLLQKILRAVFLFHPAVWWIDSRLALEREMACDDAVLAETANPRGYAKCLIGLLEKSFARRGWTMAQAAVHRAHEASLRVAQILDARRSHAKHVWKPALGIVASFSLVCLVLVPRVPEFVAFDRAAQPIFGDHVHAGALHQTEFPTAVVIPAALRTGQPQSIRKFPGATAGRVNGHAVRRQATERRAIVPQVVAARWSADADPSLANIVMADANETIVPGETLLVVRTTRQVAPNSWVWSVSVWRITLLQHPASTEPVANKT
ncbi:MAG: M56 family metallopeptidase [Candidatus Sulfotelmatobacter sp.]